MSGVDGVWPWEGAGCQTAWDAAPLEGEGCDLRMRVAQLGAETWDSTWFWK